MLLIEHQVADAWLIRQMLDEHSKNSVQLQHVTSMGDAETYLVHGQIDIILLDLGLPDAQGLESLRRTHAAAPRVPLVVFTAVDDEQLATQSLQEGAQDYLIKGQIGGRSLLRSLRYAVERKAMEDALFGEKELAQVTLNSIADAVACTDTAGNITFLNAVAERITGWTLAEVVGQAIGEVLRTLDTSSGELPAITAEVAMLQAPLANCPSSCVLVRRDGLEIPIEQSIAAIHDREGRDTGAVIVFRDVSAARAMALERAHSAEHDFLTGLPNRMLLNERIGRAITAARRRKRMVAVLFLDLDGFKHINDSLGHPVGDQLLQSVATRLIECAGVTDTVSRQGGDEFVVLLANVRGQEEVEAIACRILRSVAQPCSIGQHELHVTTSIGVSLYSDDGLDAETLIRNADTAMYQAKENGRQNFKFFTPAMNARAVERQSIEEGLRRALERDEFKLHYQPKVDLRTGAITGVEALLRWDHPKRGLLPPALFIPIAEDCGLILPIGNWVLRQSCLQAREWSRAGLPEMSMAVNVSAMEFRDDKFLAGVLKVISETRMNPRHLELELTESVLMKHAESTAGILQTLKNIGVQVAVDDFGTGYSSLSYLRKFPIDALKIDQSFVRQISVDGADKAIVTAVIAMARSLGLRVVAEGVESRDELNFLQRHQCDEAQGYYFSMPVTASQFPAMLKASSRAEACVSLREYNPGPAPSA